MKNEGLLPALRQITAIQGGTAKGDLIVALERVISALRYDCVQVTESSVSTTFGTTDVPSEWIRQRVHNGRVTVDIHIDIYQRLPAKAPTG